MRYYCGRCRTTAESEEMTVVTNDSGSSFETNIHCPNCKTLLVTFTEDESLQAILDQAEKEMQEVIDGYGQQTGPAPPTCSLEQFLPTADQCRYSLHLYGKQLEKLGRASRQLEEMIDKTEVLLEVAKEREAANG